MGPGEQMGEKAVRNLQNPGLNYHATSTTAAMCVLVSTLPVLGLPGTGDGKQLPLSLFPWRTHRYDGEIALGQRSP